MTTEPAETAADVSAAIVSIARRIHEQNQHAESVPKLSPLEVMVLRHVDHHPGTTVSIIAQRLSLHSSNTSAVVRALVERGLVRRSPDPDDKRTTQLFLTDRAEEAVATVRRAASDYLLPLIAAEHLGPLHAALTQLEHAIETSSTAADNA